MLECLVKGAIIKGDQLQDNDASDLLARQCLIVIYPSHLYRVKGALDRHNG